ncbi:M3 family metallopeptidase [Roseateles sp.]|uniref:M3 family metallopeptidase n=1 Tax=Roseateles sp. TaxID=1971397 RepID=UPI00286C3AC0|nr:M3 family metallopeptidase [Roseateles sp.]
MNNPLLSTAALPAFASIKPEHIAPAIEQLLSESRTALATATSDATPADYDALSASLGVATERLGHAWGAVGHLNAVANTPELREAYNAMLPAVTEFFTELGADEKLYAKYKAIAAGASELSAPRQQALKLWLRDFVLSGAELQGEAKARFAAIQERSAELGQQFSEHVLDATDGYAHYASAEELDGVPADAVSAALEAAKAEGKEGHKLTLHFPSYLPVMQYASNRDLRARLYRAYVTRASELGDKPELDNTAIIEELLRLRHEEAALLGFANFAEAAMVAKMADSPTQVLDFLRDLSRRARPFAEKDLAELRDFAAANLGLSELQPWDSAYASEKLKEARYAFSDQEVRQYFTVPRVLAGLFDIIERLFNVKISEQPAEVWHESVKFYRLDRPAAPTSPQTAPAPRGGAGEVLGRPGDSPDGALVGQFYLDLYARPGKRPGAWMDEVRSRWARPDGAQQTPVAQLVCNFSSPTADRPALLSHDDVTTLFHEFGHGLHHLLTQVDELGVSGISGVEWDAVELPSQFMENFCWEWEVIQQLTSHVDTAAALPRALFDKMTAAKNFQSGLQTLRQIEFSVFDMRLHAERGSEVAVQALLDEVRGEIAVMAAPAFNRSQHSFSHIFAGGYSAGYYSYKWAELLSADAWSAFEVEGVFNAACGQRYLQNVLEVGGSRPAMESFKAFRGREPQIDALLRHQGMA